jgi:hypothetical protein
MNYLFLIICSILLSGHISALKITPNKPKLCVDCKHYTKDSFTSNKYGKCSLFMIEYDNKTFLVDGINNHKIEYQYCAVARTYEKMCGQDGRFYEKK